ncbi:MAG: hypothetical protein R2712_22090 [Vicinamibacterales bacterium]
MDGEFDTAGYLRTTSDVVALAVLDHQVHAANLITRLNWEARAGTPDRVAEAADELADYLLFVDESPIPGRIEETRDLRMPSRRAGAATARVARCATCASMGASCSIRSATWSRRRPSTACPPRLARPWCHGCPPCSRGGTRARNAYAHLTPDLRRAIIDIVRETVPGLDLGA